MSEELTDTARRWCVRVEVDEGFTFSLFTFNIPIHRSSVLESKTVQEYVNGRTVDEVYPWHEQP